MRTRLKTGRKTDAAAPPPAPDTVLRLAVLLQAGLAPERAWRHLADAGDAAGAGVVDAVRRGMPIADAVRSVGGAWAEVGAAWAVAAAVGAPLAESLRGIAVALRDAHEAADDVRVTLAEPAGTAKLMGWLPLVGIGLGLALGFDTVGVLATNPLGIACLVAGILLVAAARRWTTRLVAAAAPGSGIPGMEEELLAIALSGGVSLDRARAIVDAAGVPRGAAAADVLTLSRGAGVPAVELLRGAAALARHLSRIDGRLRAAKLSTRLLLPLGVCTLPAFLLLGVAPMVLSVMATMSLPV